MIFLAWLIISAACDAIYRKCFNWIVISGLALALFSVGVKPESHPVNLLFLDSLFGFFLAFFVLLLFYKLKIMGAGDVKFSAALGAWVGWELLLPIWALSCGFSVIHGLVVRSDFKYFFSPAMKWEDGSKKNRGRFIPYVTYLSMATVIVLMLNK